MKYSVGCFLLVIVILEVRADMEGLYGFAEACIKELELDLGNYSKLLDKADDDGVINLADILDLKKATEGACILKCMLVKRGYFKPTGEVNINEKNKDHMAGIDVKLCEDIEKSDLCEEVVETSICIAKQFAAKKP